MTDWDDSTALKVAYRVIKAQQAILAAYRSGGQPPESSIDYLMKNKQRLMAYIERPQMRTEQPMTEPIDRAALEEAERQRRLSQSGWAEALQDRGRTATALDEAERRIAAVEAILAPEWSYGRAFPAMVGAVEVARLRAIAAALHPVAETTEKRNNDE